MKTRILIGLLLIYGITTHAQQEEMTREAYEQAVKYNWGNLNKLVFNLKTDAHWFKDKSGVWYVANSEAGKTYNTIGFDTFKSKPLFDHTQLAEALSAALDKEIKPTALELMGLDKKGSDTLIFGVERNWYKWNTITSELTDYKPERPRNWDWNSPESKSPDGKWISYAQDHNLYVKSTENDSIYQLTFDGETGYDYGSSYGWFDKMEGENGERPAHFGVQWSEDSKWLLTQVCDVRNASKMYLLENSIDSLYRPKLYSYYRGSPGDTTMVHVQPVFFNIETKERVPVVLPNNTHINSVYPRWSLDTNILYDNYLERGFKKAIIQKVDLSKNQVTDIYTETTDTSIDNFSYWPVEEWNKLLILSERSGWKQLYLLDLKTQRLSPLTKGDFVVNDMKYIDKKNKVVYYTASGVSTDMNPYHQQLFKVDLKGKIRLLTPEKMHHEIDFSENGDYFVDNMSTVSIPTQTVLRAAKTGKILETLTTATVEKALAEGWEAPETFELLGKDGKTPIYGAFWKPTNFDPTQKYPVIDATYTGPHTQRFPKSFDGAFSNQSWAELGFIVVAVDGLGTAARSKAFRNVSYKNMGDNLRDHVNAIQFLGEKYSWIDTDRVGIFGHSAGGYDAAHAMLAFPDFYKVAVASSGDHDFRMEKAWWPEMYMGWPVDSTYNEVSNITMAGNLKGKLLLVHGMMDDNVNPSATFKFAEALIKADKEFDLLILPSQQHGYRGKQNTYFSKKRWNYFIEHLLNKKPLWNFEMN